MEGGFDDREEPPAPPHEVQQQSPSAPLAEAFGAANAANNAHIVFRGLHNHLRQMTVKEWDPPIFAACIRGFLASKCSMP